MDLQHSFTVPVGIDDAWAAFTDIERIAPCLPGAAITSVEGDEFTGTAKVKLGPISMQYAGKGTWVSRDPDTYHAVIEAQGKDKRGNGTAGATIKAHLEPEGTGTRVVVDTELKITGRPAQFGRGVIQDVGGKLLDQFAACLAVRLAEGSAAAPAAEPAAAQSAQVGDAGPAVPVVDAGAEPAAASAGDGGSSPAVSEEGVPAADAGAPAAAASQVPPVSVPAARTSAPAEPAELNLGSVVGPALLKRLGPVVVAVVVIAVIVWLIVR